VGHFWRALKSGWMIAALNDWIGAPMGPAASGGRAL